MITSCIRSGMHHTPESPDLPALGAILTDGVPNLVSEPPVEPLDIEKVGFFELFDALLRRRDQFYNLIFQGQNVSLLIRWCVAAIVMLTGFYGMAMGAGSFHHGWKIGLAQMASSGVKVPMLYLLSLGVCYPVLYFINVLMGSKLSFTQSLSLILLAITMNAILLAGCAPIIMFFVFTGADYTFIKLMHVVIFAFGGSWGMYALWQGLTGMCEKSDLYPRQAIKILRVWTLIFAFVGIQMAWSLRPFVGSPDKPFEVLRSDQDSNFYHSVWHSIIDFSSSGY